MQQEKIEVSLVYKNGEALLVEKIDAVKAGSFYKICSVPAFAGHIAYGDLIKVDYKDGQYYFEELIEESGHSTIHVVILGSGEGRIESVLQEMGCGINVNIATNYLVIDVPALVNYSLVKRVLEAQQRENLIDYREACISSMHKGNIVN